MRVAAELLALRREWGLFVTHTKYPSLGTLPPIQVSRLAGRLVQLQVLPHLLTHPSSQKLHEVGFVLHSFWLKIIEISPYLYQLKSIILDTPDSCWNAAWHFVFSSFSCGIYHEYLACKSQLLPSLIIFPGYHLPLIIKQNPPDTAWSCPLGS